MSSINNRQLFFSHLAQTSDKPIGIEVASAKGIYIYDHEGKAFIDMISGFSVCKVQTFSVAIKNKNAVPHY